MSLSPQKVLEDVFGYAEFLNSSQSPEERREVMTKLRQGSLQLLYVAQENRKHRQLIVAGHLRSDAARYGALVLTDTSRGVLRGETSLEFREDPKRSVVASKKTARERVVADEDLGLWEALRACRQSLASEHNVPAYVIFHDKTLQEMLAYRPRTAAEMLDISGVGQTKLDRYGDRFLAVLRDDAGA